MSCQDSQGYYRDKLHRRMVLLSDNPSNHEALQLDTGKGRQMFSGVQNTIDNNGIVIFKLPQGGTIRDTGKMLYFSPDELTQKAAMI